MMNGYMCMQLCLICIRIVWIYAKYVVNDMHVQYVICDDDNDVFIMMTISIMTNECIMNDQVSCIIIFRSPTSPLLKKLHWLPVSQRIKFKIATLTFKALHFGKPSYLSDLISPYTPSRSLRSFDSQLLTVPDIRSELGRRSFSYAAPTVWNSLPYSLRSSTSLSSFCRGLKTHLFPP